MPLTGARIFRWTRGPKRATLSSVPRPYLPKGQRPLGAKRRAQTPAALRHLPDARLKQWLLWPRALKRAWLRYLDAHPGFDPVRMFATKGGPPPDTDPATPDTRSEPGTVDEIVPANGSALVESEPPTSRGNPSGHAPPPPGAEAGRQPAALVPGQAKGALGSR